jgi:hypothetical protein
MFLTRPIQQLTESKGRDLGMRLCNAETDSFKLPLFFSSFPSVDRQFGWLALLRSAPGISRRQTGVVSESEGFPSFLPACVVQAVSYICYATGE